MLRFFLAVILSIFLLTSLCGCIALLAGAAGGAGTAAWLQGKLTQEVHSPYERAIDAAKSALKSLRLELLKETRDQNVAQLKSAYTDGKEIWVDIRRITDNSSKIEVRVGVMSDKAAADKILKRILRYL